MDRVGDTDVVVVGAGVVGAAIARDLARLGLRVTLLEARPDVGAGTSKANTALLHTGFDSKPGTLEARLVRAGTSCCRSTRRAWGSLSSARARCSWRGTTSSSPSSPGLPSARAPTAMT